MSKVIAFIRKGAQGKPPTVEFKTEGVPGADCRTASKPYLDAVGGQVVSDKATAEMNEVAVVSEAERVHA